MSQITLAYSQDLPVCSSDSSVCFQQARFVVWSINPAIVVESGANLNHPTLVLRLPHACVTDSQHQGEWS